MWKSKEGTVSEIEKRRARRPDAPGTSGFVRTLVFTRGGAGGGMSQGQLGFVF